MRGVDLTKRSDAKCVQSVCFDVLVLRAIERQAKENGITISRVVNLACRRFVMDDGVFLDSMALFHEQERAKYEFLKQQLAEKMVVK